MIRAAVPVDFNINDILALWKQERLVYSYETRDNGFYVIKVNDGDMSLPNVNDKDYERTCSRIRVLNPKALVSIHAVNREKLRLMADNTHFVYQGQVLKRPEKIQNRTHSKFIVHVSTFPITKLPAIRAAATV